MISNFHTHTYRCGHAVGHEREYIEEAIKGGFTLLGISDHTPWPRINGARFGVGMDIEDLDGYLNSLRALRAEYADRIDIKIGMECEYRRRGIDWLKDTIQAEGLDYVILGNHFDGITDAPGAYFGAVTDRAGAMQYLRATIEGMETGVYAYLAHPDLFLRNMPEWNRDIESVARELCRAANDLHLPVEYNLEGVRSMRLGRQPGLGYPNRRFWDVAAEEGCTAVVGCDAHYPAVLSDLTDFNNAVDLVENTLGMKRLETIF